LIPIRALRLKRLTVVVPERHDLVLMKTLRGYQHDVEVIEQIHQRQPLVFEVLRSRWKSGAIGGAPELAVLALLLFATLVAEHLAAQAPRR
jgi:hypothetical protein